MRWKMLSVLALFGVMLYLFPKVMFWLVLSALVLCIALVIMFMLGVTGAGIGESSGQVAVRFVKEFREHGFKDPLRNRKGRKSDG